MGSQYHFYMETQVSLAVPSEDSVDLYASTQFADMCQHAAASIIDKPLNFINVTVPRLGGAFGGKSWDSTMFSAAATLAAYLTGSDGNIQVLDLDLMMDSGYTAHGALYMSDCLQFVDMGYHIPNWTIQGRSFMTNKKTMTAVRAPGSVPAALIIEGILEHVAKCVNRHPVHVKELNLYEKNQVAQGVAHILGVALDKVKVKPNQNIISPNSLVTGGSIASEIVMQAAIRAAETLKERMRPIREKFPDIDWKELCEKCVWAKIDLCARVLNSPEMGIPVNYHTYCAAVTETEVDVLTGESQIRRVDIMADYGESLNPVIDIGQTEGGFVMGLGTYLTEDTVFDGRTGRILSDGTWNYKPPTTKDIPIDWRVHLLPDTPNPVGIRSSKASGEPSIGLSVGALLANKLAIQAAKKDLFGSEDFIPIIAPFTVERAQQSVGLDESVLAL
ncbi:xanthine dehydrogenase [Elysia marginata]|uniref:Xanthine dehydrogenase n=1 Tax=Elysia marginata TaxID=1093978 RepID=A0AAV4JCA3_9GAST|nr:xanthine dehydrogenase [Elysia marginata]